MANITQKINNMTQMQKIKLAEILKNNSEQYNIYPLSYEQSRMWYLYKIDKNNAYYNVVFKIEINSEISSDTIKEALIKIIDRNTVLRTQIFELEDDVFQSILKTEDIIIPIEFSYCDEDEWEDVYNDAVIDEKNKAFDLENEIPIRFRLYELSDDTKQLMVITHHMFTDGWSMGIFRKELEEICTNSLLINTDEVNEQKYNYTDYVKWQQNRDMKCDLKYWLDKIMNTETSLNLPTDYLRPSENRFEGKSVSRSFSEKESSQIKEFAKANKVSVYTVFLSCYFLALGRMCNQNSIIVGTPVFNRMKEHFHDTIGFFANTIVLAENISESDSFTKFLKDTHMTVLEGMEHQGLPFHVLVEESRAERKSNMNPIFQTLFNMESEKLFGNEHSKKHIGPVEVPSIDSKVQFDLIFGILENDNKYSIGFSYKTCLFKEETILNSLVLYKKILKHYINNSDDDLSLSFINEERFKFKSYEEEIQNKIQNIKDITAICVSKTVYYNEKYFIFYYSNQTMDAEKIMSKIKEYTDMKIVFVRLNNFIYDSSGNVDLESLKKEAMNLDKTIFEFNDKNIFNSYGYYEFENNISDRQSINESIYLNHAECDNASDFQEEKYSFLDGGALNECRFKTLDDLLIQMDEKYLNKKIDTIQYGGIVDSFTYKELLEESKIVACNLKNYGVKEGTFVVIQVERIKDFIKVFWGCELAGAIAVPLGLPQNLEYRIDEAATKKLIRVCEMLDNAYLVCGNKERSGILNLDEDLNVSRILLSHDLFVESNMKFTKASINENDLAMILFTSGSTGVPKGVQLSHRNIIKRSQSTCERYRFNDKEVSLNWMPLDHVCGIVMCHICDTFNGSQQIHVETNEILKSPIKWILLLDQYKATMTWAPNFAYGLILEEKNEVNDLNISLDKCKFIINAGEAINYTACNEFMNLLSKFGLRKSAMYPAWGMTETCSCMIFSDDFGKVLYKNSVSVGTPSMGTKAKIVDNSMNLVPCGKIGKLYVYGETINQGYYKNEEENKKCFTSDGWFDTGDLAVIRNGEIVITGRCKDILIINGVNISCLEIEKSLEEIEGLMSGGIACCPIQDEETSKDKIVICYSITEEIRENQEKIHKKIQQKLLNEFNMYVDEFIPLEEVDMPRTSIGKIEKVKIREKYEKGMLNVISANKGQGIINSFYDIKMQRQTIIPYKNNFNRNMIVLSDEEYEDILIKSIKNSYASADIKYINLGKCKEDIYRKLKESISESKEDVSVIISASDDSMELVSTLVNYINKNPAIIRADIMFICNSIERCSLLKGYLVSACVENTNIYCKLCVTENMKLAVEEFKDAFWQFKHFIYVEIKDDIRMVQELERINFNTLNTQYNSCYGKSYVILGGLGGIGDALSRYLLNEFKCSLIIVGRKKAYEVSDKIKELSDLGKVSYYTADLSTKGNTLKILNDIENLYGKFNGIIDLIGDDKTSSHLNNIDNYLIKNQNIESISKGIKVRTQVIQEIDKYLDDKENMQVIVLSSITALFGGNSFGLYSAASSYLLNYSLKNNKNSLKVIASSKWKNVGMSEGDNNISLQLTEQIGYDIFDTDEAVKSTVLMMICDKNRIIMGVNDLNYEVSRYIYVRGYFNSLNLKERIDFRHINNERNFELENKLKCIWETVIKRKNIDIDDKFFETGGNSLKSISLIDKINKEFKVDIPVTDLFKYSTIRQMAMKLSMMGIKQDEHDTMLIEI